MTQIAPPKIIIGFQNRKNAMNGKLAFITYRKIDGTIFNETRFKKWLDGSIDIVEVDNLPRDGFVLGESVHHGNSFSGDVFNVRLFQTHNEVEFEVPVEDFLNLTTYTTVNRRYIEGECVFTWENTRLHIVSVNDPAYKDIANYTKQLFSPDIITKEKYDIGDVFVIRKHEKKSFIGSEMIYMGEHEINEFAETQKIKSANVIFDENGKFHFNFGTTKQHLFISIKAGISIQSNYSTENTYDMPKIDKFILVDTIDNDKLTFIGGNETFGHKILSSYSSPLNTTEAKDAISSGKLTFGQYRDVFTSIENLFSNIQHIRDLAKEFSHLTDNASQQTRTIKINVPNLPLYNKTAKFITEDNKLIKVECKVVNYRNKVFKVFEGKVVNGKIKFEETNKFNQFTALQIGEIDSMF